MEGYKLECIRPRNYIPAKKLPRLLPINRSNLAVRIFSVFMLVAFLSICPTSPVMVNTKELPMPNTSLIQTQLPTVTDIFDNDDDGYYKHVPSSGPAANPPMGQPDVDALTPNEILTNIASITIAPASTTGYDYFDGIYVKNGSGIPIDIENALYMKTSFSKSPRVLIIHTHACESYTPDKYDTFIPTYDDRNTDVRYNVVRVGDEIANALESHGISVIHDRTLYDAPEYSGAYSRSYASVCEYLKKYPDIEIVLDIHRDALNDPGKTKYKLVCNEMAQLMFVVGTDGNGEKHPNWENNFSFALKLQKTANKLVPGIARPIKLTAGSYNQFVAPGAIIVEIGANGNTLSEANATGRLLAECLAKVLY